MAPVDVHARDVRVPQFVRESINRHRPVRVMSHDRPQYVILHPDDYALVGPVLERQQRGFPVPISDLLDDEDIAVLREFSGEDEGLDWGLTAPRA
jgi:hypothetical protein